MAIGRCFVVGPAEGKGVTDADLAQIAEAHHMHIVGPPSQRYI